MKRRLAGARGASSARVDPEARALADLRRRPGHGEGLGGAGRGGLDRQERLPHHPGARQLGAPRDGAPRPGARAGRAAPGALRLLRGLPAGLSRPAPSRSPASSTRGAASPSGPSSGAATIPADVAGRLGRLGLRLRRLPDRLSLEPRRRRWTATSSSCRARASRSLDLERAARARREPEYRRRFNGTSLARARYDGLVRNAVLAAGRSGDRALPPGGARAPREPVRRRARGGALGGGAARAAVSSR